jgi:hypothetical protein
MFAPALAFVRRWECGVFFPDGGGAAAHARRTMVSVRLISLARLVASTKSRENGVAQCRGEVCLTRLCFQLVLCTRLVCVHSLRDCPGAIVGVKCLLKCPIEKFHHHSLVSASVSTFLIVFLTQSSDDIVVIFPTRFSTEALGSSVGCTCITVKPTVVSIQLGPLVANVRLSWGLNKIQEQLHLVNQNQRGKS